MRILITGGNGYVGRELTRRLVVEHEVAVMDALRNTRMRFEPGELESFAFYHDDVRDVDAVSRVIRDVRPDVVIHLAAVHFIPECEREPDLAIGINTQGTANVVGALAPGTRVVFASTAAVYAPDDRPHREEASLLGPTDVYGLSKLHAEAYVSYFASRRSLDARIVRLFNVVGPGETNPHVVPAIIAQVLAGARTLKLGNCHPRRDYVHIRDVVAGFEAVALGDQRDKPVEIANLGSGRAHSVSEVVDELGAIVGRPLRIVEDPTRVRTSDRPSLLADIHRIHDLYGWAPGLSLSDALRDLWRQPDIPAELLERS